MAIGMWATCIFAAACWVQAAAGNSIGITTPPDAHEPRAIPTSTSRPTSVNTACARAASASSVFVAANPDVTPPVIRADLAYECLKSIPNYQEPAILLLNSLRPYFEFQSTKDYLPDPPSGYLYPAVDLDAGLDAVQKKVEEGEYESEYDMQVDIGLLIGSVRDGHFSWAGDVLGAFTFFRSHALVAVSSDGEQVPQIYLARDLIELNSTTKKYGPVTGQTPSPVKSIDGIDAVSFLLAQSLVSSAQDPDASWNQVFYSLGNPSTRYYQFPVYYPGRATNVTFDNGTTYNYPNWANVNYPLDDVATGEDAYSAFCPKALEEVVEENETESVSLTSTSTPDPTSTIVAPGSPTIPGFPYPVIKHSLDSVAGYYLNGTGFSDVAVLQLREFDNDAAGVAYEQEYQMVVQKFLDAAVKSGKSKLVIDVQGNGGGFTDLSADIFAQLFPSKPPNSLNNMRDHLGFWILGNAASEYIAEVADDQEEFEAAFTIYHPLGFQTVVTPDVEQFPDFGALYGPREIDEGNYSALFQNDYTSILSSDFQGQGIVITGTNNRTGFRQPFAARDVVVLYDGSCASSCAVLSEYLKNYANVQFIAVGGRPQAGPMQAVGGTKGAQVFAFAGTIDPNWVALFEAPETSFRLDAVDTLWENFSAYPVSREANLKGGGVNGRNNLRVGDDTLIPLQFVYEAADCRLWWTKEMLYDPVLLWNRAAQVAFKERRGTQFNSKYCVANSTGHPTSISGGWKPGTLGPQTPPENAPATLQGWKLEGKPL